MVVVVLMLALMVTLLLAMFSVSDSELRGARSYASGQQAKQLADTAVNLAISQLRQGTTPEAGTEGTEIWSSQPGLIRKYSTDGHLLGAYKLYSSPEMVVAGGSGANSKLLSDVPAGNWQEQPERYVDLNRPVLRSANGGTPRWQFPIIDPRVMTGGSNDVRGFHYSERLANGSSLSGVVSTGGDAQRLPMPVQWVYVLKDGTLGALNAQGQFKGAVAATRENPIVGRIAFWTDDESSKVNINTAAEPTTWAVPTFFHEQDAAYSRYQPVNGEFQRYPGHPATTALSPILFPNRELTWQEKESLYNLVPKIGPGGTRGATVGYDDPTIAAVQLAQFRKEHLYANLDEFFLKDDRRPQRFNGAELTLDQVQRNSFFLTASSRSPESNPFGLPKIAMWPVSYRGQNYRTSFDDVIKFCSTLRQGSDLRAYLFQRGWADSTSADVTQPDNQALLNYLLNLLSKPIPGASQSGDQTFVNKYGDDLPQIVVELFDYIRSTNLHDANLIKPTDKIIPDNTTQNYMLGYAPSSARATNFKTFTDPRFFAADPDSADADSNGLTELLGYPGHGQVTPSRLSIADKTYQGIGRFPTITEVGLHFICNADNTNDPDNPFEQSYPTMGKPGGRSAPKRNPASAKDRWYSNFPPQPKPNPVKGEAPNLALYPLTNGYPYGPDKTHPGYQRENWNHQLVANTPLKPGFRRVQAQVLLEFFIPAAGYTLIEPELTVKVTGLSKFKVNGNQALFPRDAETFRTGRRATHPGNQMTGGYGAGLKGLLRGRESPARAPMPADNNWGNDDWEVKPAALPSDDLSVLNYDLLSNFIDIDVGADGSKPLITSEAELQIEIYSGHLGRLVSKEETPAMLVQTLKLRFPANQVKAPTLVRNNIAEKNGQPAVDAPSWWTFYSRGCMGINNMDSLIGRDKQGPLPYAGPVDVTARKQMRGRHFQHNVAPRIGNEPRRGCFFYGFDPVVKGAPRLFRPQQSAGTTQAGVDRAEEAEGSDVVQTVTIKHGDYRLTSALPVVEQSQWQAHRHFGQQRLAHNFTNFVSDHLPGFDYGGDEDLAQRLVPNTKAAKYPNQRLPDFPYFEEAAVAAHRYGDFDNGPGPARDGPYINKPDEGNVSAQNGVAYFVDAGRHISVKENFFAPNRLLPSPVAFGSLPAGVKANDAWRTLLFRPQEGHPGGNRPADHLLLEFFWMPVVEPYAISEPFSTAGKVNLNYQIFPFTNIRRASGLYAVLAGEDIAAVPTADAPNYKVWPDASNTEQFWTKDEGKTWHYKIDVEKTLAQFEERFREGRSFISASEICDVHLVPQGAGVSAAEMGLFWAEHRLTGDNTRERPYAGLYPRVTTRSNTFRVHYIAQSLTKARSSAPDEVSAADKVESEHRGSAVIERYLDPSQSSLPDFATQAVGDSLDRYHQFRITETKKFGS